MWRATRAAADDASNDATLDAARDRSWRLGPEDRSGMAGGERAAARLTTRQGECYLAAYMVGEGKQRSRQSAKTPCSGRYRRHSHCMRYGVVKRLRPSRSSQMHDYRHRNPTPSALSLSCRSPPRHTPHAPKPLARVQPVSIIRELPRCTAVMSTYQVDRSTRLSRVGRSDSTWEATCSCCFYINRKSHRLSCVV